MRTTTAVLSVLLIAASGPGASTSESVSLPGIPSVDADSMQADAGHAVWEVLRATGYTPNEWAVLLTSDADGNRRTDFLDLAAAAAVKSGQPDTAMELLVYGDAAARAAVVAEVAGAEELPLGGAVFLTLAADELDRLDLPGITLVVWEPRAFKAASNDPANGIPGNMPQMVVHQGSSAWGSGYTGDGTTIAVLDTGADPDHEALDGKIADFFDCVNSQGTAYDDQGHGTHVASIAAGNDTTNFRGLAYEANLSIVKILDDEGGGTLTQFWCGIMYLEGYEPLHDVATLSAGLAVPPLGITTLNGGDADIFLWDEPVDWYVGARNTPFTVAAGNWIGTWVDIIGIDETTHAGINGVNQVSSPGFANRAITVGAIDRLQSPGTFTALGPGKAINGIGVGNVYKPDVAAVGVQTWGALEGTTDDYEQWSGTSMATPLAAGAIALMVEKDDSLSWTAYRAALRNGASPSCIVGASPTSCSFGLLSQPTSPNFVDGWGVVKANDSLALI